MFPRLHAAEEGLEGQVKAYGNILQHLRLDVHQREPLCFERGQGRLLVIEPQRLLALFPRVAPLCIVQPAALLKLLVEEALLLLVRVETIPEGLMNV